jgi:hypothetical protein
MKRRLFLPAVVVACLLACGAISPGNAQTVSGSLTHDETWSGVVELAGDVVVPVGVTLTLLPGTSVRGHSYWDSVVVNGGRLEAVGLPAAPIEFRSILGTAPGEWGGIVFEAGSTGTLRHAIFRHGGGEISGMVVMRDVTQVVIEDCRFEDSLKDGITVQSLIDPARVRVLRCSFSRIAWSGVRCQDASPTIHTCTFSQAESAVRLEGTSYPSFNGDLSGTGAVVYVAGATRLRSGAIQFAGIPYLLGGDLAIPAGVRVEVEPGVVLKTSSYWNSFLVEGEFNLNGTAGSPVILTSSEDDGAGGDTNGDGSATKPQGNQWGGVVYQGSAVGRLLHCEFRYGGGETGGMLEVAGNATVETRGCVFLNSGEDGIRLRSILDPTRVRIDSSEFRANVDDGIQCEDASPHVSKCVFLENAAAIHLTGTSFPEFDGDLQAPGNGIWLSGTTLTRSGTREFAGIPYILNGDLVVQAGLRLGIEPGVVFKVTSYWYSIVVSGECVVEGTAELPIVFTSVRDDTVGGDSNQDGNATAPAMDAWGGVLFEPGSRGSLRHVDMRYGGGESSGMIEMNAPGAVTVADCTLRDSGDDAVRVVNVSDPAASRIERCVFRDNRDDAIQCDNASPTVRTCQFSGNGSALYLTGTSYPAFSTDLNSAGEPIWIGNTTLVTDGRWMRSGVPYVLQGDVVVPSHVSLAIDPGVVVKGSSYWCSMVVAGRLTAQGTPSDPVVFTSFHDDTAGGDSNGNGASTQPARDQWGGIVFQPGSTGVLSQVSFRFGGGESAAMVDVDAAQVSVQGCRFIASGDDAIRIRNVEHPANVTVEASHFEDSFSDAIQCDNASPTIVSSVFLTNSIYLTGTCFPHFAGDLVAPKDGVWIAGATLTRGGTWEDPGIPYVVGGDIVIPAAHTVTLAPGTVFKFSSYWNSLFVDGRLEANGSTSRPIRFTSLADDVGGDTNGDADATDPATPKPGDWGGLIFQAGSRGKLSHADLSFGGGETPGLVEIYNAQVELTDCAFQFSARDGLRIAQFDVSGAPLPVRQCLFAGNGRYGANNLSTRDLDATQNWWGHATGPYHATRNPSGEGESVTDHVLFEPFLTRSPREVPQKDSDWQARSVVLLNAQEAELLVRTGDIDNLGFGWPPGFDPFSGNSTPAHAYPWTPDPLDPEGTDRIMVISSYRGNPPSGSDGYTTTTSRPFNQVKPVSLDFDPGTVEIHAAVLQVFLDDVQPVGYHSHFTVRIDDTPMPLIAAGVNVLNQHGPIGKLMNFLLPTNSFDLLRDGHVTFLMDDLTTGEGDGFAIDFVRLLVNPRTDLYLGRIAGRITDADTGHGLAGAVVSCGGFATSVSGSDGSFQLDKVPAGLAVVEIALAGYAPANRVVDVLESQLTALDAALSRKSPARITAIQREGNQIRVSWEGGAPAFLLQTTQTLGDGPWITLLETSDRTALIPVGPGSLFLRVTQP